MNESHIHEVPKNNGRIFLMGEVLELWLKTMVRNSHVFNLSNSRCNNSFGKINVTLLKQSFGFVCQCVELMQCM